MAAPADESAPTIFVDDEPREAPGAEVTGAQILALVGKSPDGFDLYAKGHDGLRIGAEQPVEVHEGAQFETRLRL